MKIEHEGISYRVCKLRTRKHHCTTCCAKGTLRLCNELVAVFFSKRGKTCKKAKVIFQELGLDSVSVKIRGEGNKVIVRNQLDVAKAKDRYYYSVLSKYITFTKGLLARPSVRSVLSAEDQSTWNIYIKKLEKLTGGELLDEQDS